MTQEFKSFVGIDVSEDWLEVCILPEAARRRFAQDAQGWQELCQVAAERAAPLVVMEATGGLERPLAQRLSAAGIAVAVVNPRHLRQFAKGLGWLAKTDRLDAALIARYGALARPAAHPPLSAAQARLQALVLRRRQLAQEVNAEGNRLRRQRAEPVIRDGDPASGLAEGRAGGARRQDSRRRLRRRFGRPRAGRHPGVGTRRRAGRHQLPAGPAARTRPPRRQPIAQDSGKRRGQRSYSGRPRGGALRARHGGVGRQPPQPRLIPRFLPASAGRRQSQQARAHRRHAQAPGDPQRHAQGRPAMARTTISLTFQDSR